MTSLLFMGLAETATLSERVRHAARAAGTPVSRGNGSLRATATRYSEYMVTRWSGRQCERSGNDCILQ